MRARRRHHALLSADDDDPLAFVANLFDVAMVFAVALLVAYGAASRAAERVDPEQAQDALVATGKRTEGEGQRVGTAYRLADGRIIYVPE